MPVIWEEDSALAMAQAGGRGGERARVRRLYGLIKGRGRTARAISVPKRRARAHP
jgi:hypothetical protein